MRGTQSAYKSHHKKDWNMLYVLEHAVLTLLTRSVYTDICLKLCER